MKVVNQDAISAEMTSGNIDIVLVIGGILFVFVKNYYERKESKIDLEGM